MQNRNGSPLGASAERNVVVGRARIGQGLFAKRAFRAGQTIIQIRGRVVHWKLLWEIGGDFQANCIRFGPETYLDPSASPGRWINHSCEPNAAIGKVNNQLFLFAAAPIRAGAEITFDYSTTIGDDDVWTMRCKCGGAACRKRIRNFGALTPALRESYVERGMVPTFILATLEPGLVATRARTPRR